MDVGVTSLSVCAIRIIAAASNADHLIVSVPLTDHSLAAGRVIATRVFWGAFLHAAVRAIVQLTAFCNGRVGKRVLTVASASGDTLPVDELRAFPIGRAGSLRWRTLAMFAHVAIHATNGRTGVLAEVVFTGVLHIAIRVGRAWTTRNHTRVGGIAPEGLPCVCVAHERRVALATAALLAVFAAKVLCGRRSHFCAEEDLRGFWAFCQNLGIERGFARLLGSEIKRVTATAFASFLTFAGRIHKPADEPRFAKPVGDAHSIIAHKVRVTVHQVFANRHRTYVVGTVALGAISIVLTTIAQLSQCTTLATVRSAAPKAKQHSRD